MGAVKTKQKYECDSCGKVGIWSKGWLSKTIYHKRWDETLTVCSEKCADKLDGKGKK